MSLCLWAVNLTSVSDFFYFPIGGIEWLLWTWVGYFPSSRSVGGGSSLMNPQEVRFWLTHFSWGQILLKTECPDVFKNDSFSPTLLEARVHSPNPSLLHLPRSLWKPGRAPPGKIHSVRALMSGSSWSLSFSDLSTLSFSKPPEFRFPDPRTDHCELSAQARCVSLYLPSVSPVWGQQSALWPHYSERSKTSWWFPLFTCSQDEMVSFSFLLARPETRSL